MKVDLRKVLKKARKGAFTSIDFTRMAEAVKENKEQVLVASVIVYVLGYAAVSLGGVSFQSQPATGYVTSVGSLSDSCTNGAMWIQASSLRWCWSGNEYKLYDGGGNCCHTVSTGSAGSPDGAIWVQGNDLHFITPSSDELIVNGCDGGDSYCATCTSSCGPHGAFWVESSNILGYIDSNNVEKWICGGDMQCPS